MKRLKNMEINQRERKEYSFFALACVRLTQTDLAIDQVFVVTKMKA